MPNGPSWVVSKRPVVSARGVVAAQHHLAAEAGARILAQGGNAIDAAIATALAVGVVEPWLSGIGGGGFMMVRTAHDGQAHGIDFGMRFSILFVPSFAYDFAVMDDNTAHEWVWTHLSRTQPGKLKRAFHVNFILCHIRKMRG